MIVAGASLKTLQGRAQNRQRVVTPESGEGSPFMVVQDVVAMVLAHIPISNKRAAAQSTRRASSWLT